MATKKKSSKKTSSEKKLKATIKKLKAKLKRADAKATRWRTKAKAYQATATSAQARIAKLEKKLAEARRSAGPTSTRRDELTSPTEAVAPETTDPARRPTSTPDATWTVVRLREEARARGLTGMSGKPKAELLAALT